MLKYVALLFNAVALLIYQFFFTEGITVTPKIPSTATTESEFTVELTINKGAVSGFAKLQQDLPQGFTAVEDKNNGASFTFSNQSVKFIWMSLPNDKEFVVSYKVKVSADAAVGDKTIGGKFSYVADNIKQSIDIAPSAISVTSSAPAATIAAVTPTPEVTPTPTPEVTPTPTPEVTPTPTPEVTPTPTTETASNKTEAYPLTCTRKIPDNATNEFTVEVTINKGNTGGFAKLLETLPSGFTATAIESQGAAFTFVEQKVKYVWISLPSQPEVKISYKVSVGQGISGAQNINGVFSYIENDATKNFTIPASSITITAPTETTQTLATNNQVTNTTQTTETQQTTTTDITKNTAATTITQPQTNLLYRVQIMALHNAKSANTIAAYCKISAPVITEMAEGFTKYTTGSHSEYKSARDAREAIKSKGVVAPFVTAYNIGKRITVQEALMITSQKWYR